MQRKSFITLIILLNLLLAFPTFGQEKNDKIEKFLTCFQLNLAKGLDLSSFDTINDTTIKKMKIDEYVNSCKAKGMVAQISATSKIEAKAIDNSLSDKEMLNIIYNAYKAKIPELKESYLDYLKSKIICEEEENLK